MASGTITFDTSSSQVQMRLVWSATANYSTFQSTINYTISTRKITANTAPAYTSFTGKITFKKVEYDGADNLPTIATKTMPTGTVAVRNTWTPIVAGTFTVSHNPSTGEGPTIWLYDSISDNRGVRYFPEGEITCDKLSVGATITSAPNFNDEAASLTIRYSNPAGSNATLLQACIALDSTTIAVPYRNISKTGSSYTFSLTEAERQALRNATLDGKNTRTVYFYIKSTINGNTRTNRLSRTFTVINAEPSVSATFYDINATTVALTHNNEIMIKGHSNLEYQVAGTAKKNASIIGYKVTCGTDSSTLQRATFTGVSADSITFTTTDNRGLSGTQTLPIDIVDYFPVTCDFTASDIVFDEDDRTKANATVEISGKFFNSKFGAEGEENQLKLEILHTGLDDWFELPDILWGDGVSSNEYTANFTVNGLDYQSTITFQCRASDKLSSATAPEQTLKLVPVFDWGKEDFKFNVPVYFQGQPMVDFIIEEGTEPMGTNGTWYWRKWASGRADCWGKRNYGNMAATTAWGALYRSEEFTQTLPSELFVAAPEMIDITFEDSTYGAWVVKNGTGTPSATETSAFMVVRPATTTSMSQVYLGFNVIGRWK